MYRQIVETAQIEIHKRERWHDDEAVIIFLFDLTINDDDDWNLVEMHYLLLPSAIRLVHAH